MTDVLARTLNGISVVALVTNIPGPIVAARLRALGATVTKIEPPSGDPLAAAAPAWYRSLVTGIDVRALDLRDETGVVALERCLHDADLLLTSTRAGVLERLGLSWAPLHARFPGLVHVAISGEAPPHDDRAGHDLTYQARAGTIAAPAMPRALIGDMACAERATAAALGALLQRERAGCAVRADVAIVDAASDFAEPYRQGLTAADGALGGALPVYQVYPARTGFVAVAALEPHFAQRLQTLLGVDRLTRETIAAALLRRDAGAWEREAEAHDVPLAAVR